MARIRSAKPEWWKKEKWCRLPRDVRFTYKGIWEVMADDEGRFQADARLVKADVWPLDDDITTKKLDAWLTQLAAVAVTNGRGERVPAIQMYVVDGVRYGYLAAFQKHQKISHASPSKFPAPPEPLRNGSGNPPESLRPDTDKDVDIDSDVDTDAERTPAPRPAVAVGAAAGLDPAIRLVAMANRGLAEHVDPARRQPIPRIIATSGTSHTATETILQAGVPLDFAEREVFRIATTCEPDGQVGSLRYFAAAVIRSWQQEEAKRASAGVTPPALSANGRARRGDRPNAGAQSYANALAALEDLP